MVFLDAQYTHVRAQLLVWAAAQPQCAVLDSCQQADAHGSWRLLVGVRGDATTISAAELTASEAEGHWCFGGIGYDYRMQIEPHLPLPHPATIPFSGARFFVADTVVGIPKHANQVVALRGTLPKLLADPAPSPPPQAAMRPFQLVAAMSDEVYLARVAETQQSIREGEVYELNLCRELTARYPNLPTLALWEWMLSRSPVPMAAYLKLGADFVAMSASPERFLRHHNQVLVTQPIKGTVRREAQADDAAKLAELLASDKMRAENIMIADLARNDLARVCTPGSVHAHLCYPLTLSTLHHMVSAVFGLREPTLSPWQAVRAAFPPGSMTGAPKVRAMERIHELEPTDRGLYSGAIGYYDPQGNFDFNVVIRSYVYQPSTGTLSTHVGGAITIDSDPQQELAETETKALALRPDKP